MLKRLKVNNFGTHRDREVFFTEGLNTVVGPNEAGKSTLAVEAIGYAFFGTSMLRETIEDTVTTGEKVGSMKVELDYGDYKVTRSKGSAAVTGPDGLKISGQAEVSQFFYELFGIGKGSERSIAIAEQGDIQGILSARGNAKAVEFIESVAGFSQLDELVDKVKAKFPSGSKAALEAMIEEDDWKLAEARAEVLPDVVALEAELEERKSKVSKLREVKDFKYSEVLSVSEQVSTLTNARSNLASAEQDLQTVSTELEEYRARGIELTAEINDLNHEVSGLATREEDNTNLTQDAATIRARASARDRILKLKVKPGIEVWDGTLDDLITEGLKVEAALKADQRKRAELQIKLVNAEGTIGKNPICPTCGTDLSDRQEEAKKAAAAQIEELKGDLARIDVVIGEQSALLSDIKSIADEHQRIINTVTSIKSLLSTPDSFIKVANPGEIPEVYEWIGGDLEVPSEEAVAKAKAELKALADLRVKISGKSAELVQVQQNIERSERRVTEIEAKIEELNQTDFSILPELQKKLDILKVDNARLSDEIRQGQVLVDEAAEELNTANRIVNNNQETIKRLTASIEEAHRRIREDQDNAELMKEIKAARVKVINQVWNLLLQTTAEYFSVVRGQECEIVRTDKSFMVNGQKAGRLSGSTRDSFGLALRAATCEIFAPRINFLLLDEIAAGMDPERTAAAMAMVASLPIDQVILCTHEGVSDTLANNVIEVGRGQ